MLEHERTSCRDSNPSINADAEGSRGCERCTQMIMDRDTQVGAILDMVKNRLASNNQAVEQLFKLYGIEQ